MDNRTAVGYVVFECDAPVKHARFYWMPRQALDQEHTGGDVTQLQVVEVPLPPPTAFPAVTTEAQDWHALSKRLDETLTVYDRDALQFLEASRIAHQLLALLPETMSATEVISMLLYWNKRIPAGNFGNVLMSLVQTLTRVSERVAQRSSQPV